MRENNRLFAEYRVEPMRQFPSIPSLRKRPLASLSPGLMQEKCAATCHELWKTVSPAWIRAWVSPTKRRKSALSEAVYLCSMFVRKTRSNSSR
jgi:hypothetical protein